MIQHLETDGVPTLLAPTGGSMRAGLTFRVGTADETLARHGITHLLEHLVLAPLGSADYHFNGATGPVFTTFHMQGSAADIATFLTSVCANLTDLPTARLEVEKDILRTEWSSRGGSAIDDIPLWRHGARDHGLSSYPEWGLSGLTAEELRQWAARWFTRENAVLWIAGDRVPEGLRLDLPTGTRQPVPAASSALPTTPAYFVHGSRAVVLDAVVRRRAAATVFAEVLERELFRALRQDAGLSYTINTGYEPRGDGHAHLRALADALAEKQDAVVGGFIDVLAKLRIGRIEQSDLDAAVAKRVDMYATAEFDAARLPAYAFNLLTGEPNHTIDEHLAELKAVTVTDLHEVAQEAYASALLMVPDGTRADWAGLTAAPTSSESAVSGTTYHARDDDGRLLVGTEGVSHVGAGGTLTVRYADCAAMLAWPDGARQLIGHDAIVLHIEPTLFDTHPAAMSVIDSGVPIDRQITMPPRDPENIPQPRALREARAYLARPKRAGWEILLMVLSGLATLVVGGFTLLLTIGMFISPTAEEDVAVLWGAVVIGWLLAVILALPIVLLRRRGRR
ncbi:MULTISPECIES: insulinase family protein [unclassified Micromonospora]|uniref:insulinase family protein n=1 Tax=unclassified Micromonospora TaxID=2617518 RepID=UPI0022B604AA|nr:MULTISPECIES: insulinase family protein [unclassified Micromonospora]MCZ7418397.1 insulinase family protein [Verrucosispora sp. WMMA2121]WBB92128.1 insulinase family protein [Verrucosispora sp. WMMC514]